MGNLLLQGWAMLEETCPDCNVPIMRSRSKEEICVVCENAYKKSLISQSVNSTVDTEKMPQGRNQSPSQIEESNQPIDSCF